MGVALRCFTFIQVPTVPSSGEREGATAVQAACSMRAIITGVAKTSSVPLPTVLAVSVSVTGKVSSKAVPGVNISCLLAGLI